MNSSKEIIKSLVYGMHVPYRQRPSSWPDRASAQCAEMWALEWKGNIDASFMSDGAHCTFVGAWEDIYDSPRATVVGSTGSISRRLYDCSHLVFGPTYMEIFSIDTSSVPFSEIHAWMPDPTNKSRTLGDVTSDPELGITICKNLLDLMSGSIRVESTLGIGTTMHVTLPLKLKEKVGVLLCPHTK